MAITTNRIDGQTLGFRFTAPDVTTNILVLNLTTGVVTSTYLSTLDKQVLSKAAAKLFTLVPAGERAGGAIGLLKRLVTVSVADGTTVTVTASVAAGVATMVATASMAPANFIVHVPFNSDGTVTWADGGSGASGGGGLVYWVESQHLIAPNDVVGVDAFTALSSLGDSDAAIVPKGQGALLGQVPDGTAVGGDKRGFYATDWQRLRSAGDSWRVASGLAATIAGGDGSWVPGDYASVGGGLSNWAQGTYSHIGGGEFHTTEGYADVIGGGDSSYTNGSYSNQTISGGLLNSTYCDGGTIGGGRYNGIDDGEDNTIGGGIGNYIGAGSNTSNNDSTISGGDYNEVYGSWSTIGGGDSNIIDTDNYDGTIAGGWDNQLLGPNGDSTIAGGAHNIVQNDGAVVGGGYNNFASGAVSTIAGGDGNITADYASVVSGGVSNDASKGSSIGGGYANVANGTYSVIPGGMNAATRATYGKLAYNSWYNTSPGTNQMGVLVTKQVTSNDTPTALTVTTGIPISNANEINVLPDNSTYVVSALVVAHCTNTSDRAGFRVEGVVTRGAGVATTTVIGVPTTTVLGATAGAATWTCTIAADVTFGGFVITATGEAAKGIRWTATSYTTEVVDA